MLFRSPLDRMEPHELGVAPCKPTQAPFAGVPRRGVLALSGDDMIELHDDVRPQIRLDPHHGFGGEVSRRPVDVRLERDPVLGDVVQRRQREHLEAARIGEDRGVPAHEPVQSSHLAHEFVGGAEMQMVRIGEDDLRVHRLEVSEGFPELAKRFNTQPNALSAANNDALPDPGTWVAIPVAYPGDRLPVATPLAKGRIAQNSSKKTVPAKSAPARTANAKPVIAKPVVAKPLAAKPKPAPAAVGQHKAQPVASRRG